MKIGVAFAMAAMGLTAMSVAQGQSSVEGSAGSRSNTAVSADGERQAQVSQAAGGSGAMRTEPRAVTFDEGAELKARLTRRLDARRAEPGDEVHAELIEDVEANGEVVLEKGTRLVGRVTEARPYGRAEGNAAAAAESQLGVVFDKAVIGRDREIPINATIQALAAADSQLQAVAQPAHSGASPAQSSAAGGSTHGAIASAARGSGGLLGGAGGIVSGGAGAAGSLGGAVGSAGTRAGSGISGTAAAAGTIHRSGNAVGGPDSAGRLRSGSRGVFGLEGVDLVARSASNVGAAGNAGAASPGAAAARAAGRVNAAGNANAAGATVITSASGNVRLDSGTRMLLVAHGGAAASASASR
jgi:hypothetical protein